MRTGRRRILPAATSLRHAQLFVHTNVVGGLTSQDVLEVAMPTMIAPNERSTLALCR